ncbi:EPIDERMAL PATTERNING FACTOR-like protein 4 [Platanthera zijinensis]|uniref:Epidermal patterning factor-like protein n=1 Tax=Platanthera zijinensis TaxID=2320716 RepID=A0AAP0B898_9ASPA
MGLRRCRGRSLLAAIALLLFLTMATVIGRRSVGRIVQEEGWRTETVDRRQLSGPGSSPPTCRSRCGRCFPCRPIHVAIQPGRSFPLEYYPVAWRCKCRNKLFMP